MTIEELQKLLADAREKIAELTQEVTTLKTQNEDLTKKLEESRQVNTKLLLGGYTNNDDIDDDEEDEDELSLEESILEYLKK